MLSYHVAHFLLALAPQGPAHAGLHPSNAEVFLEVVEIKSSLQALEQAPLVRFLRDEKMKALFEQLGQPTDRPLGAWIQTILDQQLTGAHADARVGGLASASASLVTTPGGPDPIAILVLADLATEEAASALQDAVVAGFERHEPVSDSIPGLVRLLQSSTTAPEFWCATRGTRVLLGSRGSKPEEAVARAEGKLAGLAANEAFSKRQAALGANVGTPLLWFSLARPLRELTQSMGMGEEMGAGLRVVDRAPESLNLFSQPCAARICLAGERIVSEMVTSEPADAQAKPVAAAWLEPVPPGTMLVFSSAFDGADAAKRLREILSSDEARAATLAAIEQKLGYGPERLLARLGPGMTFYAAPPSGIGLPDSRLWIDCDDPAAFASEFEALITAMGDLLPGFQAKTKPYKVKVKGTEEKVEVAVTTLTLPPGAVQIPMISLSPSFAPVGKKLVFGFGSMDVKSELKRVHSGEGEPIVAGANPLAALGFELPSSAEALVVMDWAKLLGGVVGTIQAFAGMASPEDLPFDLKLLPTPEMFAQYFRPTFYYSKQIEGGTYRRNEASFGPETWFGLVGGLWAGFRQNSGMPVSEAEPTALGK